MKQCFGYVRVSTQKQGEGVSLDAQRAAIQQFVARNNIEIIEWFEEKQTAAKSGRPVFTAMLRLLKRGKAAGVVMHKIDRSARNFADWAKIGDLADAGIDVHFATESLDFRSRGGRLSADIQAVIAADYIRNLRDECLKGIYGRLRQGLCPWGAPLGYLNNGKGKPKTPDPRVAPYIRELFELYGSGAHSIRSLRDELERRGLRNTRGRALSKHGVEAILANPFYCGVIKMRTTGETFQGCHQPLVPAWLFERVQEIKAGKAGKKVTRHNHLYRGLFHCATCGYAMIPERQKGRVYYRCHTPECPTTTAREDHLERIIVQTLQSVAFTEDQIVAMEQEVMAWSTPEDEQKVLKANELQLAQLDQRVERLTDAIIDRLIDEDTFKTRKEALMIERERLLDAVAGAASAPSADDLRKFLELMKTLVQIYRLAAPAEKRQIIELTTSNRHVNRRNVTVQPQDWLRVVQDAASVPSGDPQRSSSRTRRHMKADMERLAIAFKSPELQALYEVISPIDALARLQVEDITTF